VVKAIGCQPRVPLSILGIITFFMLKLILNVKKSAASPRVSCSVHTHPPGGRTFRLIQIWEKRRRLTENFNVECGNHTLCLWFCFHDDRNSWHLLKVTRFFCVAWCCHDNRLQNRSRLTSFFLLTGNTDLWVQFPQTGNFSVRRSAGCLFLNKAMSLLHLFLRGNMCHLHRTIVLHTPLSTMYHCRRVILENFIFLDKSLYTITSLMKISFTLFSSD